MSLSHCHNDFLPSGLSGIISLCHCHNVLLPYCLSVIMSLYHCHNVLMLKEAKRDSELSELAFAEVGGYGKGSKCLSKGRKESTLEAIDLTCRNFVVKSSGCINMEECCTMTSLSMDLFIFFKSRSHLVLVLGRTRIHNLSKSSCLGTQQDDSCLPKVLIQWIKTLRHALKRTDAQAHVKYVQYTKNLNCM